MTSKFLSDTLPEVQKIFNEIWRERSPEERFQTLCQMTDWTLRVAKRAIDEKYPDLSEAERKLLFIESLHGHEVVQRLINASQSESQ